MLLLELEDRAEAVTDAAGVVFVHGDFEHPDEMTLAGFTDRSHRCAYGSPPRAHRHHMQSARSPRTSGGASWTEESEDGVSK